MVRFDFIPNSRSIRVGPLPRPVPSKADYAAVRSDEVWVLCGCTCDGVQSQPPYMGLLRMCALLQLQYVLPSGQRFGTSYGAG